MSTVRRFYTWLLVCGLTASVLSAQTSVVVSVTTGAYANEVSWELVENGTGVTVASRVCGSYFLTGSSSSDTVLLNDSDTYTFKALDDWGDGWNGGFYSVSKLLDGCTLIAGMPDDGLPGDGSGGCVGLSLEESRSFDPDGDIVGCTDPAASNYNPCATIDDGTCLPPVPNDACSQAVELTVGDCYSGLYDGISWGGDVVDPVCIDSDPSPLDVWHYAVIPPEGGFVLEFAEVPGFSSIVELYLGSCASLGDGLLGAAGLCFNFAAGGTLTLIGFTPGDTLRIQYWDFGSNDFGLYSLCLSALETPSPNDACADAIDIPIGTCYYGSYSEVSFEGDSLDPVCVDGDPAPLDVWHTTTIPASGNLQIGFDSVPGISSIVEVYRGSCDSLGNALLSDLGFCLNFGPGGVLVLTGFVPGEQIYIRYWDFASNDFGTYGLCLLDPGSGCTDPCASNYDPSALVDDGSCLTTALLPDACDLAIPAVEGTNDIYTSGLGGSEITACTTGDTVAGWLHYTVPTGIDTLWIYTCGANFDTGLSIWDDCPASGGSEVACNDDGIRPGVGTGFATCGGSFLQSAIGIWGASLDALEGTAILIRVSGYQGDSGCGSLEIEAVAGSCSVLSAPSNPNHIDGVDAVTLNWDPVPGSVACAVSGDQIIPPGPSPKVNLLGFEVASTTVPYDLIGAGTTWTWQVRCACSIPPAALEVTPLSEPDTFSVPVFVRLRDEIPDLSLYPNPADQSLTLTASEADRELAYTISDLAGRQIAAGTLTGGIREIAVGDWQEGFYLCHWDSDDAAGTEFFEVLHP